MTLCVARLEQAVGALRAWSSGMDRLYERLERLVHRAFEGTCQNLMLQGPVGSGPQIEESFGRQRHARVQTMLRVSWLYSALSVLVVSTMAYLLI